ncbi:peptidylprolyl isomerase [Algimonas porphyrae]|uniref:Parvulin-like PPIase n=2 Tax=Algimonas porphyrae TaxID=1128113 RepID=A0ABQ5V260_9PROT|nr:peptidylprolyl isomerase [Algimonas porphyrae]
MPTGLSLILFSAVLAGCSGTDESGTSLNADLPTSAIQRADDPVVARVEETVIYRSDVERAAVAQGLIGQGDALSTGSNVFKVTVDELIDQRLLALDAISQDLMKQEEAQRRLAAARERILGNYRIETHLAATVNEETIRTLYEAQNNLGSRGEERRIRQIVVADEEQATNVLNRLRDEEDFELLAAELSIDAQTSQSGGERGWLSRDMVESGLRDAVFAAPIGGRVGPIKAQDGWVVLEVLDRRIPNQRSFEEMREDIARFMTFEAIDGLMSDLREDAAIERVYESDMAPDASETPDP